MAPAVSGIHHATFVVRDLDAGIAWFGSVLGAQHRPRFDHHDADGVLYGVVLELPGFPGMIEIRIATDDYPLPVAGYDPVTFEVTDDAELQLWLEHLETVGALHTPIKRRRTGQSIELFTPDGALLRLFTAPVGGFDEVPFQEQHVDH
jgi:catechol 2,3-dioxygenase-like lactoylglutathione lyase family enzyme